MVKKELLIVFAILLVLGMVYAVTNVVPPMPTGAPAIVVPVTGSTGQSIIYYLKVLNANLISNKVSGDVAAVNTKTGETLTSAEAKGVKSFTPPVSSTPVTNSAINADKNVYSLKWTNLPDTGVSVSGAPSATIVLPKIKCGNEPEKALRISFGRISYTWIKVIRVESSSDGKNFEKVDCSSGWSSLGNAYTGQLVFKEIGRAHV